MHSMKALTMLRELQEKLYADNKWGVLLIFQAMDAAGKDGAIKHVFSGINPQGCQVTSFKSPSRKTWTTISSGDARKTCRNAAGSGSSTVRITKKYWL